MAPFLHSLPLHSSQNSDSEDTNVDTHADSPIPRYASLQRFYSNMIPKNLIKPIIHPPPPLLHVYSRKRPRPISFFDALLSRSVVVKSEIYDLEEDDLMRRKKKGRIGSKELANLGVGSAVLSGFEMSRLRDCRTNGNVNNGVSDKKKKKKNVKGIDSCGGFGKLFSPTAKKWLRLSFDNVDQSVFVGLRCKVYWPLDGDWYLGSVVGYDEESNRHNVRYDDGDEENLILSKEKIKFFISQEEMEKFNLSCKVKTEDGDGDDYDEMLALAASLDDYQNLEPGDIIWAKLTGHAMWPAIVVDQSLISDNKGFKRNSGETLVSVQFFGTHDFARIKPKQINSFLKGLLCSFHLKCKKPRFTQSLEEAKLYLGEQKLPKRMLQLRSGMNADGLECASTDDEWSTDFGEDCTKDEGIQRVLEGLRTSPYVIGDLQIVSLGKIVKDSEYFQGERGIWPEGYTALRKFVSIKDPGVSAMYKMEVLRDAESKILPLFRVTLDTGEQIKGSTPTACWDKIYKRIRRTQDCTSDDFTSEGSLERICKSGSDMFGFSHPKVLKLIKHLSKSRISSKLSMFKSTGERSQNLPIGYRPVRVGWKDLDKCSVCHMDEEYENNLFLQCDKCRMMVHARCYGELEPVDGALWLCNLCRPGAPDFPPPCCLCPVVGGAMKPTTDRHWAHLACAIWIPETCLSDVKKMEPIDGLSRINKDRWKLLCTICGVAYGACIQCSNNTCRVAYHPLCARAAGLCVELEDEDRLNLLAFEDDEEDHCIRLLSFCKKHRPPSNERLVADERIGRVARQCSDYAPPCNPSGCARSEPYNYFGRRGRKEPEALAAASLKRLFVEDQPYLVGGYSQHISAGRTLSSSGIVGFRISPRLQKLKASQLDAPSDILSVVEKYEYMKQTFQKRLAFGKSGIHGFGIFAKHEHKAGDMVIEYIGELVRPPIADRREHLIYNSLVGAGTYMFRINDERVIDATRAGSIAHLINHSCEPNCYSRVISINGDEHIIIFAKRDIKMWEELTYDYRFFSIDEQLPCYCGFPRCRGVVNDVEAEERVAKLYAPRGQLIDWKGE